VGTGGVVQAGGAEKERASETVDHSKAQTGRDTCDGWRKERGLGNRQCVVAGTSR
jgi:hypothetical protein